VPVRGFEAATIPFERKEIVKKEDVTGIERPAHKKGKEEVGKR